jgi:hypothetical protein
MALSKIGTNQIDSTATPTFAELDVDNVKVNGNTISSTDTNGDVKIDPAGTGSIVAAQAASSSLDIEGDRTDAQITLKGGSAGAGIQLFGSTYTNYAGAMYLDATASTTGTNDAQMVFRTGSTPSEAMRIDRSGVVSIGNTIGSSFYDGGNNLVVGSGSGSEGITIYGGNESNIFFADGTDIADNLRGRIEYSHIAEKMMFYVNNTYAGQINSDGRVNIGGTGGTIISGSEKLTVEGAMAAKNTGTVCLGTNRTDDGIIVGFQGNGTLEGTISLSGTTVSYNGGHLSRWSQLTDGTEDTTIVKGTVMTNLDQMAEWTKDGVTEDNEQLNCMAVSSVEGDANVAGVFVNWDHDDDDFNDMNIAMTGDMVIRIAQGTTVARGDLLMSAGDGTAKPQEDDIVRSKTIAKVTSTTVSHTYEDGSYLVPCVLMAC